VETALQDILQETTLFSVDFYLFPTPRSCMLRRPAPLDPYPRVSNKADRIVPIIEYMGNSNKDLRIRL
jgi:hypothetical protein